MAADEVNIADFPSVQAGIPSHSSSRHLNLKLLYRERRWFELRDAVSKGGEATLYRGAVACAFNKIAQAQVQLSSLIASAPQSKEAYEAHGLLSWMHLRKGSFPQALKHIEAMLDLRPDGRTPRAAHALFSILAQYPPQLTVEHDSCTVPFEMVEGNMFVPVAVNGKPANFMVDSGATISMITAAEADRLGLRVDQISPTAGTLYGATGASIGFRTALAAQVNIQGFQLANVAFLVLEDHQFEFPHGYRGALGLPVLLSFQTLRWGADSRFCIGLPSRPHYLDRCNICFDNAEPVSEVMFRRRRLSFALDTGSGETILGPRFGRQFAGLITRSGRASSIVVSGVSGSARLDAIRLPRITLRVGGCNIVLCPAHVLRQQTTPNSGWLFGRLGMDMLNGARQVTLDFNAMTLELE